MAQTGNRIGFLGPVGTFGEEALRTQPDLGDAEFVACRTMADVLSQTDSGELNFGFVAIENATEGTVTTSLDGLVFEFDLLIQREVVLPVHLNVLGIPGTNLKNIKRIVSFPHAPPQCHKFFQKNLPNVEIVAANSTADAAREVAEMRDNHTAALANKYSAELYGLEILAPDVQDNDENATRFVLVAKEGIPQPTGHDKTSIVCFQQTDVPGSLHSVLGEFSARGLNLTKLESRPTKKGLGDYCFAIDFEGHVADEIVGDCLRELQISMGNVKFLGSYPSVFGDGDVIRRDADKQWRDADEWLASLRKRIN